MIAQALLAGAVVGLGLYALVRVYLRPRPGIAALVGRIDASRRSMTTYTTTGLETANGLRGSSRRSMGRLADVLEVQATERGWHLGRTRQDLAVMSRSIGSFLAQKVVIAVVLFLLAPLMWSVLRLAGAPLPMAIPLVVAALLGLLGFFLPDIALRSEAEKRRRDFRHVVGVFLDLVAMNLAGGRGLPEALLAASTVSEHWALIRIRQALANARLMGTTPWEALAALGNDLGVEELRDLGGALGLAADDGAKIKASLSARAASLRRKELTESEGEAGERSQSMLVAQLMICAAFLVFLVYPAVVQLSGI